MTIDPASPVDIDAMVAIMAAAFDPRFGEAWSAAQLIGALAVPDTWALIAHEGAVAIGFALVRCILDEAELMLTAVEPSARRQGWGKRLLAEAVVSSQLRGARTMFLEVRASNEAARRLYDMMGFRQVGHRKDYYQGRQGERFDAITMRRIL